MSNVPAASASTIRTLEELSKKTRTTGDNLGQGDFLKLMIAQMANQDPLSPTSNEDFLAQMAQFTMLEQIKEMGQNFLTSQAYSMIGQHVYVQDGNELIYGRVDGVVKENGVNYLLVGGEMYNAANVAGVVDSSQGLDKEILQSASLIGRTVTATVVAEDGTTSTITGEVTRIVIKDGAVYAMVGDEEVPIFRIKEISSNGTTEATADGADTAPSDDITTI